MVSGGGLPLFLLMVISRCLCSAGVWQISSAPPLRLPLLLGLTIVMVSGAQARRRIADEEEANKQGGFGLLQADTSGFFDVEQQAEALAFFQENGCAFRERSPARSPHRVAASSLRLPRSFAPILPLFPPHLPRCLANRRGAASAQTSACSARWTRRRWRI